MPRKAERLSEAEDAQLVRARQNVNKATWERDQLIADVASRGVSLRSIAEAAGVSHETVRRIVARERRSEDAG